MGRGLPALLLTTFCLFGAPAHSQPASAPSGTAQPDAKPVLLRGTLGDEQVQVTLRRRAGGDDGYEGEYFVFGQSQRILLAGDVDADDFVFEESENGIDISGQWEGKRTGDTMSGTWQSADGAVKKPFLIKVLRIEDKTKQRSPRPAS
jgi:hypothetical protein